jgi:hypothetical protein
MCFISSEGGQFITSLCVADSAHSGELVAWQWWKVGRNNIAPRIQAGLIYHCGYYCQIWSWIVSACEKTHATGGGSVYIKNSHTWPWFICVENTQKASSERSSLQSGGVFRYVSDTSLGKKCRKINSRTVPPSVTLVPVARPRFVLSKN